MEGRRRTDRVPEPLEAYGVHNYMYATHPSLHTHTDTHTHTQVPLYPPAVGTGRGRPFLLTQRHLLRHEPDLPHSLKGTPFCPTPHTVTSTHPSHPHYHPLQRPSPEIKAVLYELLFQLLLNNWRYTVV